MSSKKHIRQNRIVGLILLVAVAFVFLLNVAIGSVYIPIGDVFSILVGGGATDTATKTILYLRLPEALTALAAGMGLAVGGLQMQTLFRNPLAGPYVLGISSGASLGVAIVILFAGTLSATVAANIGVAGAAIVGSSVVLLAIIALAKRIRDNVTLLIVGLMVGQVTGAIVGMMKYFSDAVDLQSYVLWGLGNFSNVRWEELLILLPVIAIGVAIAFVLSKPLNALLLGENYARTMGLDISSNRFWIIMSTGLLAGSITAYCGPIAFLGLAVPHLTRSLFNTSDHRTLIPMVCLLGAGLALLCDIVARMPFFEGKLPINGVTTLIGAPVVIWIIMKRRNLKSVS